MLLQKQVNREAPGTEKKLNNKIINQTSKKPQPKLRNRELKQDILPVMIRESKESNEHMGIVYCRKSN